MLRVILDVNGDRIGEFHILNVGIHGDGKRQKRKYRVQYFRELLPHVREALSIKEGEEFQILDSKFSVIHYREDGALVLVKKVLDEFFNPNRLIKKRNSEGSKNEKNKGVENRICGNCNDYYVCKSDSKVREEKYLPKNKKGCKEWIRKEARSE